MPRDRGSHNFPLFRGESSGSYNKGHMVFRCHFYVFDSRMRYGKIDKDIRFLAFQERVHLLVCHNFSAKKCAGVKIYTPDKFKIGSIIDHSPQGLAHAAGGAADNYFDHSGFTAGWILQQVFSSGKFSLQPG